MDILFTSKRVKPMRGRAALLQSLLFRFKRKRLLSPFFYGYLISIIGEEELRYNIMTKETSKKSWNKEKKCDK